MKQQGHTLLQALLGLSLLAILCQLLFHGMMAYMKVHEQQALLLQRQGVATYILNRIERSLQVSGFFLNATERSQSFSEILQTQPGLSIWQCALTDKHDDMRGLKPIRMNRCAGFKSRAYEKGILLSYLQQEAYSINQTLWCDQKTRLDLVQCPHIYRWYLVHEGYQLGQEDNRGKLFYVWAHKEGNQLIFYREVLDSAVIALGFKYMLKTRKPIDGKVYYRSIDAQSWPDIDFNVYSVIAVQVALTVALDVSAPTKQESVTIQKSRWVLR